MVYCKFCDKEVEPILKKNRYYCPSCKKYVKTTKKEKSEPLVKEIPSPKEPEINKEEPSKSISTKKTVDYDASDLHIGQILIDMGYAQDLGDLARKNMKLAFSLMNMGALGKQFNAMELNKEQTKEETFEDIDKMKEKDDLRRYKNLQIKRMEKELNEGNSGQKLSEDKMIESMEKQIRIKTMKEALKSGNEDGMGVNELFKWKIMSSMFDNPGKSSDSQAFQALQTQFNSLQEQMRQERNLAQQKLQNETVIHKLEQFGNQKGMTAQDVLSFTADKQSAVKEAELEIQKQREYTHKAEQDALRAEQNSKMKELEIEMEKVKSGKQSDLKDFVEKFKEVKQISAEIGEREKGTGEMVMEGLGKVAESVGPSLAELIKQKREQQPPQQLPPPAEQLPPELPPEQPNPEPNPLGLTETERQMSDQNAEMYIYTDKNKKNE